MELFYKKAANCFEETLPVGNGSLGAMIFGGIKNEKLGLNEESLWSGYQRDKNRKEAYSYLEEVRKLVFEKKFTEAEKVVQEHMLGEYTQSYLPMGNLHISMSHGEEAVQYKRSLELEDAVARVEYAVDGIHYKREYFASYPAQMIVMRFLADRPVMGMEVQFESLLRVQVIHEENRFSIEGQCPEHMDPNYVKGPEGVIYGDRGMRFTGKVTVRKCDGGYTVSEAGVLNIEGAREVILTLEVENADRIDRKKVMLHKYSIFQYDRILEEHIRDYRKLFDRVVLYLGEQLEIPTDERLERLRAGEEDNGLYALYFQYGRYLLIASSREGSLPANLQGIWSWEYQAPWSSNFTTNINTEMNYWHAESCNLKECLTPLFDYTERLCEQGKKTAKAYYGCRGFVHHHNGDYWASTNPTGMGYLENTGQENSVTWSMWPMGGAWMCAEFFKYWEYQEDRQFLEERVYPILKEAALFFVDFLVKKDGVYVTCPSTSPENRYKTPEGDTCITMSSAMDLELIREVFSNFKKTCEILGKEEPLLEEIEERLAHLSDFKIGSKGQLLEWNEEFEEVEPGHRHMSHLYGLFPSELFAGDEKLMKACKKSLEIRLLNGGEYTGWSLAWIINLYAIFGEGEKAYECLRQLLTRSTYDNLWDAHPPFQIDGNFGGMAAIANMLVQDRNGEVKILPALPKQFKNGFVKGLCIKGNKAVDITWRDGKEVEHRIYDKKEEEEKDA